MIAWSGGLDSTVLLHLLCQVRRQYSRLELRAVHVDHGLQPAAADFCRFCRSTARRWQVPLRVLHVTVQPKAGESVEEAARDARYAALAAELKPGELLLAAQHADDQLETLLLALLRGAGPAGLAAMPAFAPFASGFLVRPLLGVQRSELADYAKQHGLVWEDDPTNASLRFDRNYLRASVLPALRARWPAVARTVGRSAAHCAEASVSVALAARRDLETAADGADLEIAVLRRWSPARRTAVLRLWITGRGFEAPEARQLEQIPLLMEARPDARPELRLREFVVRRHDGRLLLQATVAIGSGPSCPPGASRQPEKPLMHHWSWRRGTLRLAEGELSVMADPHGDLDLARLPSRLQVQCPAASGGRDLRKLLQELQVPGWQRSALPLGFADDKGRRNLLGVADLWLAGPLRVGSAGRGVQRGRFFWRASR